MSKASRSRFVLAARSCTCASITWLWRFSSSTKVHELPSNSPSCVRSTPFIVTFLVSKLTPERTSLNWIVTENRGSCQSWRDFPKAVTDGQSVLGRQERPPWVMQEKEYKVQIDKCKCRPLPPTWIAVTTISPWRSKALVRTVHFEFCNLWLAN